MSKPGVSLPKPVALGVKSQAQAQAQAQSAPKMTVEQERKKKRSRRLSAPAKTTGPRRQRNSGTGSEKRVVVESGEVIQEEVIVEE